MSFHKSVQILFVCLTASIFLEGATAAKLDKGKGHINPWGGRSPGYKAGTPLPKPVARPPQPPLDPLPPSPPVSPCLCGHYNEKRMTKGKVSSPWRCKITIPHEGKFVDCAGTLIDSQWVLTVAHCTRFAEKTDGRTGVIVQCGDYVKTKGSEGDPNILEVDRIIEHPRYNGDFTPEDNIALLHIEKPMTLSADTQPACLPWKDQGEECNEKDTKVTTTLMVKKGAKEVTKIVNGTCYSSQQCDTELKNKVNFKITDKLVCTKDPEPCPNDSGNAIIFDYSGEGRCFIVGVNVVGPNCGATGVAGISVKLGKYLDWITQQSMGAQYCDENV